MEVILYEGDESGNESEVVGRKFIDGSDGWAIWRDIDSYVDGSNDLAEFYVKIRSASGLASVTIRSYD